jgi:hypothetical protein
MWTDLLARACVEGHYDLVVQHDVEFAREIQETLIQHSTQMKCNERFTYVHRLYGADALVGS